MVSSEIYAIVTSGGRQYKVVPGETIEVDRLPVEAGGSVALDKVLLIAEGDKVTLGTPNIEGAKVMASVVGEGRGEKTIVFKYKPKARYRRKTGHRRRYTRLAIEKIVSAGRRGSKKG